MIFVKTLSTVISYRWLHKSQMLIQMRFIMKCLLILVLLVVRNSNMNKILSTLVLSAFFATCFTGCGEDTSAPKQEKKSDTNPTIKTDDKKTSTNTPPAKEDIKADNKVVKSSGPLAVEWSHWRGPTQNGVSTDKNLPEKWSPNPETADNNLVWKTPFGGRTTPIVQNDRVYIINKVGKGISEQERVMCFSMKDGKLLWEYKFNVFHTDIVSVRLGWTNMTGDPETGNVYAHGTQGLLFCFDKDGKVLWSKSLTEEYGRITGYGGRVTSPIVEGDLLIIGMINASWGDQGMGRNRFVAFNKKTGVIQWWAFTGATVKDTYYSYPVVANINGQRLLISGGGDGGVHAFKVNTGEKVWSYLFGSGSINCSPVVQDNFVYIGQGEENIGANTQGRVICLDAGSVTNGQPKVVWQADGIKAKFASPVINDGILYMCGEVGSLHALEASSGKELWKFQYGRNTKGSPVLADGKIYIAEVNSKFHILQPSKEGCKRLHAQLFKGKPGEDGNAGEDVEINGSPAIINGKIIFMTSEDLYCIGKPDWKPSAPEVKSESKAVTLGEAAHLQIVPADFVLNPEAKQSLAAFAYDANGNKIGPVEVEWSLAGVRPPEGLPPAPPAAPGTPAPTTPPLLVGKLSNEKGMDTVLEISKAPPAQFGRVVAKAGKLTAETRVRVSPILPYAPNFANIPEKRTPGGWINCQGKFEMVTVDGKKILKKLAVNPSPLVARANAFITMPDLTDYTIQADMMGTKVRDDLPDMGVVANRYSFMLTGKTKSLRLISWDALPRVDKTISYPWEPNVWYTFKLSFEKATGTEGTIRGKIWPRDKPEPAEWTLEFKDPVANLEGSAGIYGYSAGILENQPGTEIFYDNVKVLPNKK